MSVPIINENQVLDRILKQKNPFFDEYYAYYSSWFGGIVKNPSLMLLPIDDHMVHRGDGVFEAMKAVARSVYLMDEHLHRLWTSAEKIGLQSPVDQDALKTIILETLSVADKNDASIRIFLSRGPGNFSANPYDSIGPQLYVVVTKLTPPAPVKYEQGIVIGQSHIPVKSPWIAQIKSCNYLPNVLMKKEAIDRALDFVIAIDSQGYVTESATENIMIVDKEGRIVHPPLDTILKGTTMTRACELAAANGFVCDVRPISVNDLLMAREILIAGTSLNILPVIKYEDQDIGNGKPGPIAKTLNQLMLKDIEQGLRGLSY